MSAAGGLVKHTTHPRRASLSPRRLSKTEGTRCIRRWGPCQTHTPSPPGVPIPTRLVCCVLLCEVFSPITEEEVYRRKECLGRVDQPGAKECFDPSWVGVSYFYYCWWWLCVTLKGGPLATVAGLAGPPITGFGAVTRPGSPPYHSVVHCWILKHTHIQHTP